MLAWPERAAACGCSIGGPSLVAVALGVLYTGNSGTYYAGLEDVPVSLASLIVYIYPAIVAVMALRVGRRLEGRRPWFALGLALVGVALAVGGIPEGTPPPLGGLALIVASPIIYSIWIVLSARLAGERRESVGRDAADGADAAAATALMMSGDGRDVLAGGASSSGRRSRRTGFRPPRGRGLSASASSRRSSRSRRSTPGRGGSGPRRRRWSARSSRSGRSCLAAILFGQTLGPTQLLGGAFIIVGVLIAQAPPEAFSSIRPGVRLADE